MAADKRTVDTLCHSHSRSLAECERKGSEGCYIVAKPTEATLVDRLRASRFNCDLALQDEAATEIQRLELLALEDDCARCAKCMRVFAIDDLINYHIEEADPLCEVCYNAI